MSKNQRVKVKCKSKMRYKRRRGRYILNKNKGKRFTKDELDGKIKERLKTDISFQLFSRANMLRLWSMLRRNYNFKNGEKSLVDVDCYKMKS